MSQPSSMRNANLLYLMSILLVVLLGSAAQSRDVGWGLIFTEVVCILLPTLWLLRREGAPLAEALAWRPARPAAIALAVPIGLGAWALGAVLTGIMVAVTGYEAPAIPLPTSIAAAIPLFLGLVLFAPVCEEVLFRGYLFRAYGGRGARVAILASALLFAFFHLRLQGLPGLLPAAFALGILRWRTGSLLPGILAHAAQNTVAATLMILPLMGVNPPPAALAFILLFLAAAGILAFLLFLRTTPAPAGAAAADTPVPRLRLTAAWPLIPFALLYLYVGGLEAGLLPIGGPKAPPMLTAAPLDQPQSWRYEMRNTANEAVGEMECQLTPEASSLLLVCRSSNRAWRIEQGGSLFMSEANTTDTMIRWSRSDLRLLELSVITDFVDQGVQSVLQVEPSGDGLLLTVANPYRDPQQLKLPPGAVLFQEWAWRLALAQLSKAESQTVAFVTPNKWSPKLQDAVPAVEPVRLTLDQGGAEAGRSGTWRASLGTMQQAWFDTQAPHTLLRLDIGVESYRLIED